MLINFTKLLRAKHWIKNGLIAAPFFFAFAFTWTQAQAALLAIAGFCLLASGIYIVNDIADRENDRHHPTKRHRPIASGSVPPRLALWIAAILLAMGMILLGIVGLEALLLALVYMALNLAYSFSLKHVPIVDVMIVAFGFVIRVMIGAYAIGVPLSHWILLCTFFVALFISFGKRKHEMSLLQEGKRHHRKAAAEYTDRFIDQMLALTAGTAVVFYSLYTIDPANVARFGTERLIYTTPIVVFGIFRYYYLLYNRNEGGDPVQLLLKDKQLILCLGLWLLSVAFIYIYGSKLYT